MGVFLWARYPCTVEVKGCKARDGCRGAGLRRGWEVRDSGDTTPCRMTGVTLHSHVHYKKIQARTCAEGTRGMGRGVAGGDHVGNDDEQAQPPDKPQNVTRGKELGR